MSQPTFTKSVLLISTAFIVMAISFLIAVGRTNLANTVILITFGVYVGLWLHEGMHFMLAKILGWEPQLVIQLKVFPSAVNFSLPRLAANYHIRTVMGSPIIFPIGLLIVFYFVDKPITIHRYVIIEALLNSSTHEIIIISALFGASAISASDWLGVMFPDGFREYYDENQRNEQAQARPYLIERLTSSVCRVLGY